MAASDAWITRAWGEVKGAPAATVWLFGLVTLAIALAGTALGFALGRQTTTVAGAGDARASYHFVPTGSGAWAFPPTEASGAGVAAGKDWMAMKDLVSGMVLHPTPLPSDYESYAADNYGLRLPALAPGNYMITVQALERYAPLSKANADGDAVPAASSLMLWHQGKVLSQDENRVNYRDYETEYYALTPSTALGVTVAEDEVLFVAMAGVESWDYSARWNTSVADPDDLATYAGANPGKATDNHALVLDPSQTFLSITPV